MPGRVASIGVSNFDSQLLGEFWGFGSVRPHLVQNFAEPGSLDLAVRQWCSEHGAVYMPYAHQRNLKFLAPRLRESIQAAAYKYGVSPHVVISRFFYQTGEKLNRIYEYDICFMFEMDAVN
jgi:diketogulonate reductase-like aldo/keto reductase